jgi:hypothetical protein
MVGEFSNLTLIMVAQDNDRSAGREFAADLLDLTNELAMSEGGGHMYTQVLHGDTNYENDSHAQLVLRWRD